MSVFDQLSIQLKEKIRILAKFNRVQLNVKDFKFIRALGKGGFGAVYLAQRVDNKKLCAVKVMSKTSIRKSNYELQILRERKALSLATRYPDYFVRLQCAFQCGDNLFLVMEYMPGGDCMTLLESVHRLPEIVAQHIIAQVVVAVKHLHFHGVVHRDIKPDNIMVRYSCMKIFTFTAADRSLCYILLRTAQVTNRGHAKLGDFGLVAPYIKDFPPGTEYDVANSTSQSYSQSQSQSTATVATHAHTVSNSMNLNSSSNVHGNSARLIAVTKRSRSNSNSIPSTVDSVISDHLWLDDDKDIINPEMFSASAGGWSQESSSSIFFQKPNAHLKITSQVGNYYYACPEIVIKSGYDHTVDWWAVGVMLFHFVAGITPFEDVSKDKTLENIVQYVVNWSYLPNNTSEQCKKLIAGKWAWYLIVVISVACLSLWDGWNCAVCGGRCS